MNIANINFARALRLGGYARPKDGPMPVIEDDYMVFDENRRIFKFNIGAHFNINGAIARCTADSQNQLADMLKDVSTAVIRKHVAATDLLGYAECPKAMHEAIQADIASEAKRFGAQLTGLTLKKTK